MAELENNLPSIHSDFLLLLDALDLLLVLAVLNNIAAHSNSNERAKQHTGACGHETSSDPARHSCCGTSS